MLMSCDNSSEFVLSGLLVKFTNLIINSYCWCILVIRSYDILANLSYITMLSTCSAMLVLIQCSSHYNCHTVWLKIMTRIKFDSRWQVFLFQPRWHIFRLNNVIIIHVCACLYVHVHIGCVYACVTYVGV